MVSNFWQDKRVCVTGGAGFLGSFVTAKLRERGAAEIFIPTIEKYDLVNVASIRQLLDDSRPDIIIHLAAHKLIHRHIKTFAENIPQRHFYR